MDRIFRVSFRVVRDLSFAAVLGMAFIKGHGSTISFDESEGFRPTPGFPWVPFSSHIADAATSSTNVAAPWNDFCTLRPAVTKISEIEGFTTPIPEPLLNADEETLDGVFHPYAKPATNIRSNAGVMPLSSTSTGILIARRSAYSAAEQLKLR